MARKRIELPIGSKQMLLLHVDRRWLYKMVIGTANVNSGPVLVLPYQLCSAFALILCSTERESVSSLLLLVHILTISPHLLLLVLLARLFGVR